MQCVDVIADIHANLPSLGSEPRSMPTFNLRMLQCVGYLLRITTYLR